MLKADDMMDDTMKKEPYDYSRDYPAEDTFNLLEEEWIPVLMLDADKCQTAGCSPVKKSIKAVLAEAQDIADIATICPLERISIYRLLMTILYASDADYSHHISDGSKGKRKKTMLASNQWDQTVNDNLEKYYEQQKENFFLFSKTNPFMQTVFADPLSTKKIEDQIKKKLADEAKEKIHPVTKLMIYSASATTPTTFDHSYSTSIHDIVAYQHEKTISLAPDAAARALLVTHNFAFSGGRGHMPGWLSNAMVCMIKGETLLETLLLNMVRFVPSGCKNAKATPWACSTDADSPWRTPYWELPLDGYPTKAQPTKAYKKKDVAQAAKIKGKASLLSRLSYAHRQILLLPRYEDGSWNTATCLYESGGATPSRGTNNSPNQGYPRDDIMVAYKNKKEEKLGYASSIWTQLLALIRVSGSSSGSVLRIMSEAEKNDLFECAYDRKEAIYLDVVYLNLSKAEIIGVLEGSFPMRINSGRNAAEDENKDGKPITAVCLDDLSDLVDALMERARLEYEGGKDVIGGKEKEISGLLGNYKNYLIACDRLKTGKNSKLTKEANKKWGEEYRPRAELLYWPKLEAHFSFLLEQKAAGREADEGKWKSFCRQKRNESYKQLTEGTIKNSYLAEKASRKSDKNA